LAKEADHTFPILPLKLVNPLIVVDLELNPN